MRRLTVREPSQEKQHGMGKILFEKWFSCFPSGFLLRHKGYDTVVSSRGTSAHCRLEKILLDPSGASQSLESPPASVMSFHPS